MEGAVGRRAHERVRVDAGWGPGVAGARCHGRQEQHEPPGSEAKGAGGSRPGDARRAEPGDLRCYRGRLSVTCFGRRRGALRPVSPQGPSSVTLRAGRPLKPQEPSPSGAGRPALLRGRRGVGGSPSRLSRALRSHGQLRDLLERSLRCVFLFLTSGCRGQVTLPGREAPSPGGPLPHALRTAPAGVVSPGPLLSFLALQGLG